METQDNNKAAAIAAFILQNSPNSPDNQDESPPPPNTFSKLIEKQAKQFEEFGKRMSTQLQTSYQEYIKLQNEKLCEKYQKQIDAQSELIEDLIARIKNLEMYSNKKDQDIRKLRQDFLQHFLQLYNKSQITTDIKGNSVSFNDEFIKQFNIKDYEDAIWMNEDSNWEDDAKNENLVYSSKSLKAGHAGHAESANSFSNPFSSQINSLSQENNFKLEQIRVKIQQIITRREDNVKKKHFKILAEDFTSNDLIQYTNSENFNSLNDKVKRFINNLINKMLEDEEKKLMDEGSTREGNLKNVKEAILEQLHEQLHSQIQQIITRKKNSGVRVRLKNFKVLNNSYTTNDLIQYTKTNQFNSLNDDPKRLLNLLIYGSLSGEFEQQNVILSQNLEEYTKRGIVPELPSEYSDYTEYAKSTKLNKLSKIFKKRVRKLITLEKERTNIKNNNNVVLFLDGKEYILIN